MRRPAATAEPTRLRWEVLVVLWLYVVYDIINNLSSVDESRALARARDILAVERRLGLDVELGANRWLARRELLGSLLANYYNLAHIWLTLAVLVLLWLRRRSLYADLRNALVAFNLIGFAVFWSFPVAPPRMLDGFVDVVEQTGAISSFHDGALAEAANQYAAMPSLHVAWAIWVVVALYRTSRSPRVRALAWAHITLTVIAVVATANHFVLDIVAGAVTAVVGFACTSWWARTIRPQLLARRGVLVPDAPRAS